MFGGKLSHEGICRFMTRLYARQCSDVSRRSHGGAGEPCGAFARGQWLLAVRGVRYETAMA